MIDTERRREQARKAIVDLRLGRHTSSPRGLKAAIYDKIRSFGHVSFAELSRLDDFAGDSEMTVRGNPSISFWSGMSGEAIASINELLAERRITMKGCHWLVYFCDGRVPRLPVAKRMIRYKKPRWMPVSFNAAGTSIRREVTANAKA